MRTLFLNPPSFGGFDGGAGSRYQARREVRSFWYPTWLAYPAAMVPESKLVDAPADDISVERTLALAKGYDLIVIHTSTPSLANDAKVAEALKDAYPGVKIGFVGPTSMVRPKETIEASPAIDFVTTGEFDHAVARVAEGRPWETIKGLYYRENGGFRRTEDQPPLEGAELDALPFVTDVYKRDLTIENYAIGYLQHPYVSLYTGRGCRSQCTFCLWPQTISGHAYRVRSAENVIEEMRRAKEMFPQVREFFFDDDTFTDNIARAEEIARGLGKLGIAWSCNAKAIVPRETLEVLKDNGLRLLLVGFESGNQEILNNIKKGVRLDRAREFVKNTKELGILVHGTFIVGLPGETPETIEETVRFAQEIDPYSIQVSLAAPYPGTYLYDQAIREGWLRKEGDGLTRGGIQDAALGYEHLSREEIFEAMERFYRRFYFRPRPILRIVRDMLADRQVMRRRLREGREFLSFMAKRKEAAATA